MTQIVLSEDQARLIRQAHEPIQMCDPHGNVLAIVNPAIAPEFIAEMKRRAASPGPWYTGEQVAARLRALQEGWERTGGFDHAHMLGILARLDASDPGHMRGQARP